MARDHARRVRRARALARDPTASRDALRAHCASGARAPDDVATVATAGARGCGKTTLVRRFFAASTRRRGRDARDRADDARRATRTIGMDFGVVARALERADEDGGDGDARAATRVRIFDPSGADAHAACRETAYRRADAVLYVLDRARRWDDARRVERGLREIVDARRGETRAATRVLFASPRRDDADDDADAPTVDRRPRATRATPDVDARLRDVRAACAAVLTTHPRDIAFARAPAAAAARATTRVETRDALDDVTVVDVDARADDGIVDAFRALVAATRRG